jgi:hypothetical protein
MAKEGLSDDTAKAYLQELYRLALEERPAAAAVAAGEPKPPTQGSPGRDGRCGPSEWPDRRPPLLEMIRGGRPDAPERKPGPVPRRQQPRPVLAIVFLSLLVGLAALSWWKVMRTAYPPAPAGVAAEYDWNRQTVREAPLR